MGRVSFLGQFNVGGWIYYLAYNMTILGLTQNDFPLRGGGGGTPLTDKIRKVVFDGLLISF